jgi:hypothetical protein
MDCETTMQCTRSPCRPPFAAFAPLVLDWLAAAVCLRRSRHLKLLPSSSVLELRSSSIALTCSRRRRDLMPVTCCIRLPNLFMCNARCLPTRRHLFLYDTTT